MVQTKKDDVKNKILNAAKEEFLKFGFEKASLRKIAAEAGVTKGNLYTYFKSKDALYGVLIQPAMDFLMASMTNTNEDYIKNYGPDSEETSVAMFQLFLAKILELENEFKLLFFSSNGSTYAGFREQIYRAYCDSTMQFIDKWNDFHQRKSMKISEMLLHTLAALYLSFIEEILLHEPDNDELMIYVNQMANFVHAGISRLLNAN